MSLHGKELYNQIPIFLEEEKRVSCLNTALESHLDPVLGMTHGHPVRPQASLVFAM